MNAPLTSSITLAGGCFWCIEAVFENCPGVLQTLCGYCNGHGHLKPPVHYRQVCAGDTGYAEAVRLEFDAARVSLAQILERFLAAHDPSTLNAQGEDIGEQYRSAVFWHSAEQVPTIHAALAYWQQRHQRPSVTQIQPLRDWCEAEAEHQHYFARNPGEGYCALVIRPKLEKLQRDFPPAAPCCR